MSRSSRLGKKMYRILTRTVLNKSPKSPRNKEAKEEEPKKKAKSPQEGNYSTHNVHLCIVNTSISSQNTAIALPLTPFSNVPRNLSCVDDDCSLLLGAVDIHLMNGPCSIHPALLFSQESSALLSLFNRFDEELLCHSSDLILCHV